MINIESTKFKNIKKINLKKVSDYRGNFYRLFCKKSLSKVLNKEITQSHFSHNKNKGTIRGLHFQKGRYKEIKIVICLSGSLIDYSVDIKKNSKMFLKHYKIKLMPFTGVVIPENYAHGFQTLEDNTNIIYYVTNTYNTKHEGALNIFDPKLSISLPLKKFIISKRDQNHKYITEEFLGI